jgi:uncharacterized damage-inducible protein DinB
MSKISPFVIADQSGFTPHISRLVSMMNYARRTTLDMVKFLKPEELDFLPSPDGNSIAMLLEHMAAVEVYYQVFSFDGDESKLDRSRWEAGLELGDVGRDKIRNQDVHYYLSQLQEVREKTLSEFARRDDTWLHQEFPFWGQTANYYFCWFHVFEDEINHRGQIRLIVKQLPSYKKRGFLGIQVAPAKENGVGLMLSEVFLDGPASRAGLKSGDIVIELNQQNVEGICLEDIVFQGQVGEVVVLKIYRPEASQELYFEVTREKAL